jgi:predicted metal-binding protein
MSRRELPRNSVTEFCCNLMPGLTILWEINKHVTTELKHKEIVAKLEGRAFHMGFAAGECSLCLPQTPCSVLKGQDCSHPLQARPTMEACGFDVFTIARRVGWKVVPIGHESKQDVVPCASLIGLVLEV